MDKKKLKLSISGNTKKTISNIEQAKSNPRNSVIIKNTKTFHKKKPYKPGVQGETKYNPNSGFKKSPQNFFHKKDISDFEKRKLARI